MTHKIKQVTSLIGLVLHRLGTSIRLFRATFSVAIFLVATSFLFRLLLFIKLRPAVIVRFRRPTGFRGTLSKGHLLVVDSAFLALLLVKELVVDHPVVPSDTVVRPRLQHQVRQIGALVLHLRLRDGRCSLNLRRRRTRRRAAATTRSWITAHTARSPRP